MSDIRGRRDDYCLLGNPTPQIYKLCAKKSKNDGPRTFASNDDAVAFLRRNGFVDRSTYFHVRDEIHALVTFELDRDLSVTYKVLYYKPCRPPKMDD